MMNRCRIIRGIIVIAFITCLCLVSFVSSNYIKGQLKILEIRDILVYVLLIFVAIIGYAFLKKKLRNSDCNKNLEYIYRYIYLILFIIFTRFLATILFKTEADLSLITPDIENGLASYLVYFLGKLTLRPLYSVIILNTIITVVSMVFVKRIVFNVTTNEMLSAMAAIVYIFIPSSIIETTVYNRYNFNLMYILITIYMLLKVIDEIKQHKLKNHKYMQYTLMMSAFMVIDILLGGSTVFWVLLVIVSMLVSKEIDYVHICFKKEHIEKFSLKIRRVLYKIERMRISKFVTILCILTCFLTISSLILQCTGQGLILEKNLGLDTEEIFNIVENNFMSYKIYYVIVCILTIILEMLCFGLSRKQDTKSAILKFAFISLLVLSVLAENENKEIILSAMLTINLITNIGNIYYNREEKVKLLKDKN